MLQVNHMVVLAGPPACGKSTVLDRIGRGELPDLPAKLGIDDYATWAHIAPKTLDTVDSPRLDRAIFHYDFLRQWKRADDGDNVPAYADDDALGVLERSGELTLVTVWTQPAELVDRVNARTGRRLFSTLRSMRLLRTLKIRRRLRRQQRLYGDKAALLAQYALWHDFCRRLNPRAHYILDTTAADPVVHPFSDWDRVTG